MAPAAQALLDRSEEEHELKIVRILQGGHLDMSPKKPGWRTQRDDLRRA